MIIPIFVFFVTFTIYVSRLHPGLPGGDAGELMSACALLTVAHPPGYPLYTVSCHALSRMMQMFGMDGAQSIHAFSAVVGAAASAVIASCLQKLCSTEIVFSLTPKAFISKKAMAFKTVQLDAAKIREVRSSEAAWLPVPVLAAGFGISFALVPIVLQYSTEAEVFSMNNLLVAVMMRMWISDEVEQGKVTMSHWLKWTVLAATAMCHQHAILFLAIPVALRVLYLYYRAGANVLVGAGASILGTVALCGVLYISLFSLLDTAHVLSWGNISTVDDLIHHYFRVDYGTFQLHSGRGNHTEFTSPSVVLDRSGLYWQWLTANISTILPMLVVAILPTFGYVICVVNGDTSTSLEAVSFWSLIVCAVSVIGFNTLSNISLATPVHHHVVHRFWLQSLCPLWVAIGSGAVYITREVSSYASFRRGSHQTAAMLVVVFTMVCWKQYVSLDAQNVPDGCSIQTVMGTYGELLLGDLNPGDVLITIGDQHLTAIRYAQNVVGLNTDVVHVDYELAHYKWYRDKIHTNYNVTVISPREPHFITTIAKRHSVYLLEDAVFLGGADNWKEHFVPVYGSPSRWVYRLVPKEKYKPCGCPELPSTGVVLENFETCFTDISKIKTHPWEAAVGVHYGLSKKNLLLQEAVRLQHACKSSWTYGSLLSSTKEVLHPRTLGQHVWNASCRSFVDALQKAAP